MNRACFSESTNLHENNDMRAPSDFLKSNYFRIKNKGLFLLFVFMILLPVASNGQVGNLLRNKLNKVVNAGTKTVDKEINKEIDTAVEKGVLNARDKAASTMMTVCSKVEETNPQIRVIPVRED